MVPDEVFDELLVELTGAELKVLLYIIRRTFGFKRESDTISLSQMLTGIHTRDGRVLDRGVGLSKKTLLDALRNLSARRIILSQRRQSAEKGNEPTAYRLNVLRPGGTPPVTAGGAPPWGNSCTPLGGESAPRGRGRKCPKPLGEKLPHTRLRGTRQSSTRDRTSSSDSRSGHQQRPRSTTLAPTDPTGPDVNRRR